MIKQITHGARSSSIEEFIEKATGLVIERMLPHLTSQDLKWLFKALHFNDKTNQHELNDAVAFTAGPILHEGSEESGISGCLPKECVVS